MANDRKASLLDEAAEIAMDGWHSVEKARAFACAVSDYLACTRDDCTWRSEPNQSGIAREVCDCGAVRSGACVPAATPAAPGEVTASERYHWLVENFDVRSLVGVGDLTKLDTFIDGKIYDKRGLVLSRAASGGGVGSDPLAVAALSNPAPVAAPAPASEALADEHEGWRCEYFSQNDSDRAPDWKVEYVRYAPHPGEEYKGGTPRLNQWRNLRPLFDHAIPTPGDSADAPVQQAGDEQHGLDTDARVCFYEQDFYVLSNFSSFSLEWKGIRFDTSEAAYHWEKFVGKPAVMTLIQHAPSAHEAFKIAEYHKPFRRPDWDAVKVGIMREILRAKADQHEYVRRKLLATGDRELVENSWRDDYWGWGPNQDGQNMLGKLWMEVRAALKGEQPVEPSGGERGPAQ